MKYLLMGEEAEGELSEADCITNTGFKMKINPRMLAHYYIQQTPTVCLNGTIYSYRDGAYKPFDKGAYMKFLGLFSMRNDVEVTKYYQDAVRDHIRMFSQIDKEQIASWEWVTFQDCNWNMVTEENAPHEMTHISFKKFRTRFLEERDTQPIVNFFKALGLEDWEIDAIQEFAGACMCSKNELYEFALFLIGPGKNGKTVTSKIFEAWMYGSDQVKAFSLQDLTNGKFMFTNLLSPQVVMAITGDIDAKGFTSLRRFKAAISGELFSGEQKLKQDTVDARPQFKFLITCNSAPIWPKMEDKSDAMFRRSHYVQMAKDFDGFDSKESNPEVVARMTSDDMLTAWGLWAAEGLRKLVKVKFSKSCYKLPSHKVRRLHKALVGNPYEMFTKDACSRGSKDTEAVSVLYDNYRLWCEYYYLKPTNVVHFSRKMRQIHGVEKGEKVGPRKDRASLVGVALKDTECTKILKVKMKRGLDSALPQTDLIQVIHLEAGTTETVEKYTRHMSK